MVAIIRHHADGNKTAVKNKLVVFLLAWLTMYAGCNNNNIPKPPSPAELARQGFASPEMPRITAEELKIMYDNREPLTLVDVRARSQYLSGYIPGARNIPGDTWEEEESFNVISTLPGDRLIITYCDCLDDGESAVGAERLVFFGYDNVRILWKGIYYWQEIGGEVRE